MRLSFRLALVALLFSGLCFSLMAHGNQPGESTISLEGGKVTVKFIGPEAKGRDLLALIKPGMYWRMGADAATTLTTEVDLMFGDMKVAKGEYTLVAHFEDKESWSLVVAQGTGSGFAPTGVVGKVRGSISSADESIENLKITLEGSGKKAKLVLAWGTRRLAAEFTAA